MISLTLSSRCGQSGEQCQLPSDGNSLSPCHSTIFQSSIYIDNWSAGYTITDNVVSTTRHSMMGWIFFQFFKAQAKTGGAAAHDNTARGNTICDAGPPPKARDPWDEPTGANVTGTVNVSAGEGPISKCVFGVQYPRAEAVVHGAGPRL